jgi:hypothetical protein
MTDLATLLPDWRISLRAKGRSQGTILSYLNVATNFHGFLVANGMPTTVTSIKREHVEHFLADMFDRLPGDRGQALARRCPGFRPF